MLPSCSCLSSSHHHFRIIYYNSVSDEIAQQEKKTSERERGKLKVMLPNLVLRSNLHTFCLKRLTRKKVSTKLLRGRQRENERNEPKMVSF